MSQSPTAVTGNPALDLLSSPFGGSMPSIGGDAGPSSAASVSGQNDISFQSAFSVSGAGGNAAANATGSAQKSYMDYLLYGAVGLGAFFLLRGR